MLVHVSDGSISRASFRITAHVDRSVLNTKGTGVAVKSGTLVASSYFDLHSADLTR